MTVCRNPRFVFFIGVCTRGRPFSSKIMPRKPRVAVVACPAPEAVSEMEPNKENVSGNNPDNPSRDWEAEMEVIRQKMQKMEIEKEEYERRIQEQAVKIEEQEAKIALHSKEQEGLQEKLKKLQKVKEFQPVLSIQLPDESSDDSKGKKKKNDPTRVKRPVSSFLLWCDDQREKIRAENPDMSTKELAVKLGEIWKAVSAEEKKPYEATYQKNKEEYLKIVGKERREAEAAKLLQEEKNKKISMELLEQYVEYKKETQADQKGKKKAKDPEKPKRAMSAYLVFSEQRRPELMAEKKMSIPEVGKVLGEEWRNMDEQARAPFAKIALEKKNEYLAEMEAYKKKKAEEDDLSQKAAEEKTKREHVCAMQLLKEKEKQEEAKKVLRATRRNQKGTASNSDQPEVSQKKAKGRKVKAPGEPSKPLSAYILFGNNYRKQLRTEMPEATARQVTALVGSKWKEMSNEEKQPYVDQAAAEKQQYEAAMEKYKNPGPDVNEEDDRADDEDGEEDNEGNNSC